MTEAEQFGHLLRRTRKANRLTLGELAEKAGTGPKHLGRIERGEKQPSFELIIAIANAMDVSPACFFAFEDLRIDQPVLKRQLSKLLDRRDPRQLQRAYRILRAALEP